LARFSLVAHRPTGSNVCLAVDTFNSGTAAVSASDGVNARRQAGGYVTNGNGRRPLRYASNPAAGDTAVTSTPSVSVFWCAGLDQHSPSDGSFTADSSATRTSANRRPGRGGNGMFAWVIPLVTLTAEQEDRAGAPGGARR
jgi:hypothetical protein